MKLISLSDFVLEQIKIKQSASEFKEAILNHIELLENYKIITAEGKVHQNKNDWNVLDKVKNPFAGMLQCLYEIKFKCKNELTDDQKDSAFRCLNVIAEDESNDKETRAWCYNQLALIHSGMSKFIKL